MLPGWIEALASAWRAAEIIDSEKVSLILAFPVASLMAYFLAGK